MRDFDDCFLFIVVVVAVVTVVVVSISSSFSFQLVRQALSSNIIKARMKKTRTRLTWYIIIIDFLHVWCYWCVQRLKKWLIDDVRVFVELALSKMRLMFDKQIRMRVRFDFSEIANMITLLCRHFDDNIVVFSWRNFSTRIA